MAKEVVISCCYLVRMSWSRSNMFLAPRSMGLWYLLRRDSAEGT